MNIQNKTILITGANRGIGRALVTEALRRGAKRVYAGTRSGELQNADSRVTPLTLDVTNTAQIQAAVEKVESLDILINNAGLARKFRRPWRKSNLSISSSTTPAWRFTTT